jgi:hypothetical protein
MSHAPDWLAPARLASRQWAVVAVHIGYLLLTRARRGAHGGMHAVLFSIAALLALLAGCLDWTDPRAPALMAAGAAAVAATGFLLATEASGWSRWLWQVAAGALLWQATLIGLSGLVREGVWSVLALAGARLYDRGWGWAAPTFGATLACMSGVVAVGLAGPPVGAGALAHVVAVTAVLLVIYAAVPKGCNGWRDVLARSGLLSLASVAVAAVGFAAAAAAPVPLATAARVIVPTTAALAVLGLYRLTDRPEARAVGMMAIVTAGLRAIAVDLIGGSPRHQVAALVVLGAALIGATILLRRGESTESS